MVAKPNPPNSEISPELKPSIKFHRAGDYPHKARIRTRRYRERLIITESVLDFLENVDIGLSDLFF